MKIGVLILFVIVTSIKVFSQKSIKLIKAKELSVKVIKEDNLTRVKLDSVNIELVFYNRTNEYYTPEDTVNRDYANIGHIITIDSLTGISQIDYTGSYDYFNPRAIVHKNELYIILLFADTYIYGTDQELSFVVFKENANKKISVVSCYSNENNKPIEDIRIIRTANYIELKGKFLKNAYKL